MPDYGAQIILHKWPVGQNNFENNTVHLFIFGSFLPCGSGPTNLPCAVHDGIGCRLHTVLGVGCRPRPCVTDQPAPGSRVGPTPLPSLYLPCISFYCIYIVLWTYSGRTNMVLNVYPLPWTYQFMVRPILMKFLVYLDACF